MNLVYFDPYPNKKLEGYIESYAALLKANGEEPVTVKRVETVDEVLKAADVGEQASERDAATPHNSDLPAATHVQRDGWGCWVRGARLDTACTHVAPSLLLRSVAALQPGRLDAAPD